MNQVFAGMALLLVSLTGVAQESVPAAAGPAASEPPAEVATASPERASLTTRQGSRLLLPTRQTEDPMPIVILLPYTGSTAQRLLDWYYSDSLPALADELSFAVLLPAERARRSDYASSAVWNVTLERFKRSLAADVDELVRDHGADAARIVLAGYSMGGDLAWATLHRDTQRYAGAIVMGSRASYRDADALTRLAEREVRVFLFMGEREDALRLRGMRAAGEALQRAGISHRDARAPGGHVPAPPSLFNEAIRYVLGRDAMAP